MTVLDPYYRPTNGGERAFAFEGNALKFGRGVLAEVGGDAADLGVTHALLVTDVRIRPLPVFGIVEQALRDAGVKVSVFDAVAVEPTDAAILAAAEAAREGGVDGFVSLGGGSVMDTAKAANLLYCWPAPFLDYVNAPLGRARRPPGPLKPHIACPTTFGTAAETTGIAIFDLAEAGVKTGIVSRALRPTLGVIDPQTLDSLPVQVVAANGFDVLSHAIESFTARPYTAREKPAGGAQRPQNQGANPFSSLASLEAVRLVARHLAPAVADSENREARTALMYAGLLAGIGFGNAGNHLPHAMSYPVAHHIRDWRPEGWAGDHALAPHGIAVAVNAPAAFRHAARHVPSRFAEVLRAWTGQEPEGDIGDLIHERFVGLMRETGLPGGLLEIGFEPDDVPLLAREAFEQKRLIDNAPGAVGVADLEAIYRDALRSW